MSSAGREMRQETHIIGNVCNLIIPINSSFANRQRLLLVLSGSFGDVVKRLAERTLENL
jgi:hypothetical protein